MQSGTSPGNVRPRQKRRLGNLGQPGRRKLLTGLANLRESLAVRSSAATRFGLGRIAINGQVLFRLLLNLGLIENDDGGWQSDQQQRARIAYASFNAMD
mgnify:FL=1